MDRWVSSVCENVTLATEPGGASDDLGLKTNKGFNTKKMIQFFSALIAVSQPYFPAIPRVVESRRTFTQCGKCRDLAKVIDHRYFKGTHILISINYDSISNKNFLVIFISSLPFCYCLPNRIRRHKKRKGWCKYPSRFFLNKAISQAIDGVGIINVIFFLPGAYFGYRMVNHLAYRVLIPSPFKD